MQSMRLIKKEGAPGPISDMKAPSSAIYAQVINIRDNNAELIAFAAEVNWKKGFSFTNYVRTLR